QSCGDDPGFCAQHDVRHRVETRFVSSDPPRLIPAGSGSFALCGFLSSESPDHSLRTVAAVHERAGQSPGVDPATRLRTVSGGNVRLHQRTFLGSWRGRETPLTAVRYLERGGTFRRWPASRAATLRL